MRDCTSMHYSESCAHPSIQIFAIIFQIYSCNFRKTFAFIIFMLYLFCIYFIKKYMIFVEIMSNLLRKYYHFIVFLFRRLETLSRVPFKYLLYNF